MISKIFLCESELKGASFLLSHPSIVTLRRPRQTQCLTRAGAWPSIGNDLGGGRDGSGTATLAVVKLMLTLRTVAR